MLNESEYQASEVPLSNLPSTEGTSDKGQGGGALLTAPSVLISKKNKNTNARRTAPTQDIQSQALQRTSNNDKAPTSDKNRTTAALSEDKSSESKPESSNSASMP